MDSEQNLIQSQTYNDSEGHLVALACVVLCDITVILILNTQHTHFALHKPERPNTSVNIACNTSVQIQVDYVLWVAVILLYIHFLFFRTLNAFSLKNKGF